MERVISAEPQGPAGGVDRADAVALVTTKPAVSVPGAFAPHVEVRRYVFEMRSQLGQLPGKVVQLGRRGFSARRVSRSPPGFLVCSVHRRMSPGGRRSTWRDTIMGRVFSSFHPRAGFFDGMRP